jgi:AcrR family transcriptional regulator
MTSRRHADAVLPWGSLPAAPGLSPEASRSRQRILLAARDEFACHGLGGARVDRIAAAAGINKRMLYHYIGNKDALFSAVLEASYAHKRERERALGLQAVAPREAVRRFVELTWRYYLEHPEYLTLLNSANLHRARHLSPGERFRQTNEPLTGTLGEVLARGVREGVFRDGVDPAQLYITIAGLSWFYLSNQHTLSAIFGRELLTAPAREERLRHMTDVVLAYLAVPEAAARPSGPPEHPTPIEQRMPAAPARRPARPRAPRAGTQLQEAVA